MKLFLAKGAINKINYPDSSSVFPDQRLVWADNWDEACAKYKLYWMDQESEYSVSYAVHIESMDETIG